ncbi:MAG: hypothetical protein ACTHU0_09555 [Kofleriaceae bacterium]
MTIDNQLETLSSDQLSAATGGASEWMQTAWDGARNAAGGFGAAVWHGPTATRDQVERWADPNSQATKFGFEVGTMAGMRRPARRF